MFVLSVERNKETEIEFVTSAGAMGYDGRGHLWEKPFIFVRLIDTSLFAHTMKTITLKPRKGNFKWWNPLDCVKPYWQDGKIVGAVNAVGLSNPGFDWWMKKIGGTVNRNKLKLIGSLFGEPCELKIMAPQLNNCDLVAIEIDASCPSTQCDILTNSGRVIRSCETVKARTKHPVILKLSTVHDLEKIIPEVDEMVSAYAINSVPWETIFPSLKSPFAKYGGGGVSGKIAQSHTWIFAKKIKSLAKKPVIVPGIWDYADVPIMHEEGFEAFSFGSVHLWHPCRPTSIVKRLRSESLFKLT